MSTVTNFIGDQLLHVSRQLEVLGQVSCEMHKWSMCGTKHGCCCIVQVSKISPSACPGFYLLLSDH